MPTRSYYAYPRPRTAWGRGLRWLRNQRTYIGWIARALTDRDVPAGTVGRVVGSWRQDGDWIYAIAFPELHLHVPLPWPGIELIEPGNAVRSVP